MAEHPLARLIAERLVPWPELAWPIDWDARFGRRAPLALEIGFGNGDFLIHTALERPDRNHVGIEIAWGSVHRLLTGSHRAGAGNVLALEGDAGFLVEHLFAPDSLDEVVINFSDPWRKARHHRRRLVQAPFLTMLGGRMRTGAPVTIATDHAEYAEWIAAELERQTALEPAPGGGHVQEVPGRRPTRYEMKAREEGRPIHFFLRRRAAGPHPPLRREEIEPMPNVLLENVTVDPVALFPEPRVFAESRRGDGVVVKLLSAWRRADGRETMVETLVQEGPFRQHFAVLIERRREGPVVVQPASLGAPRPTWGVKRAVYRVVEILLAADPGARVRVSTVGMPGED